MSDNDLVKIVTLSKEMGLSHKTIYNWVNDNRLEMKSPGYVSRSEAWDVLDHMRSKRVEISYFMSAYGITRDSYGRFSSDSNLNSN
jgi:predicted DNA-binding transcriptional regulator AlpA